jgi:hypothetical protein
MPRRVSATKQETPPEDPLTSLTYKVEALNKRVESLEASRPGRKAKPLIALRQDGVCAVSPDIDSSECPNASIFRYQQGCHGTACKARQHNAYERRKQGKVEAPVQKPKRRAAATKEPVAVPAKTKAPAKANGKAPTKRAPRRLAALAAS